MPGSSLTIVFDNYPYNPELAALWGFAAVIRLPEHTILFDTGSNGRVLLKNMAALRIDPRTVDLLFLSHPHWDHIGGLDSFIEVNPSATVVVHEGFSKHLVQDLRTLCAEVVVVGPDFLRIAPGICSTGMFESDPPEQAMVLELADDIMVISGCAHPGMERIVAQVQSFLGKRVRYAVGGFHLMYADAATIERSIASLQRLGVEYLLPTHCSGDDAREAFRRGYGARCLEGGAGMTLTLDDPGS